ncbi:DUF2946 family protein [Breoghania sp.]|uniref:DUF2946 family protein n=1 Tax=Breoghania sp. TaxID=2065378 RepID=UPI002AA67261|nr:hypothetical protein [Breoghania sp.]
MKQARRIDTMWVAIIAAYMLVVQSLVGAVALGHGPETVALDFFGNPICSSNAGQTAPASDDDRSKIPDCCRGGTCLAGHALPGRIDTVSISFAFPSHIERPPIEATLPIVLCRSYSPAQPRAPPLQT